MKVALHFLQWVGKRNSFRLGGSRNTVRGKTTENLSSAHVKNKME